MKALMVAFGFIFLTGICFGHPADNVKMSFDSTGTILTIVANHSVKTPGNHYIMSIVVDVNGKELVKQTYLSQLNKNEQMALYKIIDIKKNDKLTVSTQCNITGRKKETLIYAFENKETK